MVCNAEACAECTQKCLMVHKNKKNHPPAAASFFKIMIGDQISKVLFLPPKFAPTVSKLVGQRAVLEDSGGLHWRVTISRIDNSLAFEQGWNSFSLEHNLRTGDFLVFNYIMSSHFTVKIYDKSGCEKLNFPDTRNQKKTTKDNRTSTVKDDTCHTVHRSSVNKKGSGTSVVFGSGGNSTLKDGPCRKTHKSSLNKQGVGTSAVFGSDTSAVNDGPCHTIHKSSLTNHCLGNSGVFGSDGISAVKGGPCHTSHKSSLNKQGLGTSGVFGSDGTSAVKDGPCHTSHKSSLNKKGLDTSSVFGSDGNSAVKYGPCHTINESSLNKHGLGNIVVFGSDEISAVKDGSYHTSHKSSLNKQDSGTSVVYVSDGDIGQQPHKMNGMSKAPLVTENASNYDISNGNSNCVPKEEYIEEMMWMDRELGDIQDLDRTCIFDLSDFEMVKMNIGTGGSDGVATVDETWSHQDDSSLWLRSKAGSVDKNPVAKEAMSTTIPMDKTCSDHDDSSLGMRNGADLVDNNRVAMEENTTGTPVLETCSDDDDSSPRLKNEARSVDNSPVAKEAMTTEIPPDETYDDDSSLRLINEAGSVDRNPVAMEEETKEIPVAEIRSNHDDLSPTLRKETGSVGTNVVAKEVMTMGIPLDKTCLDHDGSSLRLRNEAGLIDENPVAKDAETTDVPVDGTCSDHNGSSLKLRNEDGLVDRFPVAMEEDTAEIPVAAMRSDHDDSSPALRNETVSVDTNAVAKEVMTTAIPLDETCLDHDDSSLRLRNEAGLLDENPVAKEAETINVPVDETCSDHDDASGRLRNEADSVDKSPVNKEVMMGAILSDASNHSRTEEINCSIAKVKCGSLSDEDSCSNKTSRNLFPTVAVKPEKNEKITSNISNSATEKCRTVDGSESISDNQVEVPKTEHYFIGDSCQRAEKEFTGASESFDEMIKTIKIESVDLASDPCIHNLISPTNGESLSVVNAVDSQVSDTVKSEPVDAFETLPSSSNFSCLAVAGSQSFLELPVSMPMPITVPQKRRPKRDRRVVLLRDPVMRLWPVLYIEKDSYKLLINGWEEFSKASNIEEGDGCLFRIEDESAAICSVHIIKK